MRFILYKCLCTGLVTSLVRLVQAVRITSSSVRHLRGLAKLARCKSVRLPTVYGSARVFTALLMAEPPPILSIRRGNPYRRPATSCTTCWLVQLAPSSNSTRCDTREGVRLVQRVRSSVPMDGTARRNATRNALAVVDVSNRQPLFEFEDDGLQHLWSGGA